MTPPRHFIAIDPGPVQSAVIVWDGTKIRDAAKMQNRTLFHAFYEMNSAAAQADAGPSVICERVESYGMAVGRDVFETCFWTGRFWEWWHQAGRDFHLVPRREVKLHLCGRPQAKDGNIRQALIDRFGPKGTKKSPGITYGLAADTWQAFALAVTSRDQWSSEFRDRFLAGSTPQPEETKG